MAPQLALQNRLSPSSQDRTGSFIGNVQREKVPTILFSPVTCRTVSIATNRRRKGEDK